MNLQSSAVGEDMQPSGDRCQNIKIYYLNLASRLDRREFMEAQFDRLGLKVQRIDAVTPDGVPFEIVREFTNRARYRWLTLGQLACSLSHLAAMQTLLVGSSPYAAIFEDDAELSPTLPAFLTALTGAPVVFDLIRLETFGDRLRLHPVVAENLGSVGLRHGYTGPNGSAGYIISRAAAQIVLKSGQMYRAPADRALFDPFEPLARRLTLLHTDPGLCVQLDRSNRLPDIGRSDLADGGAKVKQERAHRRPHHAVRGWLDANLRIGVWNTWHDLVDHAEKREIVFKAD